MGKILFNLILLLLIVFTFYNRLVYGQNPQSYNPNRHSKGNEDFFIKDLKKPKFQLNAKAPQFRECLKHAGFGISKQNETFSFLPRLWHSEKYLDKNKKTLQDNTSPLKRSPISSLESFSSDTTVRAWVAHYSSGLLPSIDEATAITSDHQGNIYVTGYSESGVGLSDFLTIKYSQGSVAWTARYNGSGSDHDIPTDIEVDSIGNVYVTGYSYGRGTLYDYATVKYNHDGKEEWVARYSGPGQGDDAALSLAIDNLGNVYITGFSDSDPDLHYSRYEFTTIKYDQNGNEKWVIRYAYEDQIDDIGVAVEVDAQGNVCVAGMSYDFDTYHDYLVIKYDPLGNEIWKNRFEYYGGDICDHVTNMTIDNNGSIYITGQSGTIHNVAKINSDGILKFQRGGIGLLTSIAVDQNGNIIVAGGAGTRYSGWDYVTIKYDSNGVDQWEKRYSDPSGGNDGINALTLDKLGNIYVTGLSTSSSRKADFLTIKYSPTGIVLWNKWFNGKDSTDYANDITLIEPTGSVFVTGVSFSIDTCYYDYCTIEYAMSNGLVRSNLTYDGPGKGYDIAKGLAVDSKGNIYIIGTGLNGSTLLKYNSSGTLKWIRNSPALSVLDIGIDDLDKIYIMGNFNGSLQVKKYNSEGLIDWSMKYPFIYSPVSYTLAKPFYVDKKGNLYSLVYSTVDYSYRVIKHDSDGNLKFNVNYSSDSNTNSTVYAITADNMENLYMTGKISSDTSSMYYTVKYDVTGTLKWTAKYMGDGNSLAGEFLSAIEVDNNGNVYVGGGITDLNFNSDFFVIKYDSTGTIKWIDKARWRNRWI
ncbi:MAG: SBBP repeat-containing protein [Bacteroidota bacterium]|nr:SBBP repeat-containing protein [Bacteroidota bacterium]